MYSAQTRVHHVPLDDRRHQCRLPGRWSSFFRSKESLTYGQLPLTVILISTFPPAKRRLRLLLSAPPCPGDASNQSRLPKAAVKEPPALPPRTHKDSSFGCSIPRSELRFSWLVRRKELQELPEFRSCRMGER